MSSRNIQWPDALVELTRPLYESGHYSCAEVGRKVGKTRGAIIGKAHRDGWINPNPQKGGVKPGEKRPRAAKGWNRKSAASIFSNLNRVDPGVSGETEKYEGFLGKPLSDLLDSECHYIEGSDRLYCGQPSRENSSYCNHHHAIVWTKPPPRRGQLNLPPMNGTK